MLLMLRRLSVVSYIVLVWPMLSHAQLCNPNVPASTPTSQFLLNTDGTVTDQQTGLTWKRCSEGQTWNGITCVGQRSLHPERSMFSYVDSVNNTGFAGKKDWRIPNIKELFSIVEERCLAPSINTTVFPNTPMNDFWTSSWGGASSVEGFFLGLSFEDGDMLYISTRVSKFGTGITAPLRLVRGN